MVDEHELRDYAANNTISAFKIIENSEGKFNLYFYITWKNDGISVLSTVRKELRKWASINTLVKFIVSLNVPDATIQVIPRLKKKKVKKKCR